MQIKQPAAYDISHWKEVPDFALVSPKPLLFITKATEGTGFIDDKFVRFFEGMKQIGVVRGCFHFHRKAFGGLAQAEHFIRIVRPYVTPKDVLILDVEEGGESVAQMQIWFERVREAFPSNLLMLYSRKNILDPLASTAAQRLFFRGIPTWTAGYPDDPDLHASVPSWYIPDQTKWGETWLWQYSENGAITGIIGSVDLNWMHQKLIDHISISPPPPPPTGDTMTTTTYANNVKVITGNMIGLDYRVVSIPATAIKTASYVNQTAFAEEIPGDIVFNLVPFNLSTYLPTKGVRVGGKTLFPYHAYEPFGAWRTDKKLVIYHPQASFNSYANACQGFRYLIENGVKNPKWDDSSGSIAAWSGKHARRALATNAAGDTVIITTKGSGDTVGMTLHQLVDLAFALQLGITMMFDGDSGSSTQDYIRVNGLPQLWQGDVTGRRKVPVFGVITLNTPLAGTEPPPTTVTKTHTIDVYSDGSIKVDGNAYP